MKHEFGNGQKPEQSKQMAKCAGCGKKEPREGWSGMPKGWLGFSTPLLGEPWVVEVCSWKCEHSARMDAVQAALKARAGAKDEPLRPSDGCPHPT